MRSKKTWLLNSEGNVFMILSATVLLLLSASFWLLKQQKITTAISIASTDLSALQHMKPIVVKATKPTAQGDSGNLKNSNWFATIQKEMSKSEYFIREDASSGTLGSPNRKNNLRFTYDANGFSVKPRATKIPLEENKPGQDPDDIKYKTIKDWAIRFDLNNSQWGDGYWKIANNKAEYITDKVTVQYDNQEEGMRQNFVVHTPLEKGKSLAIDFKVSTTLKVTTNKEALNFGLNGEQVMQYKDLKVWDANGKSLTASLQYNGKEAYSIEVDDSKAVYPVTIDPISTTAATLIESTQEGAQLGYSVSGAGDVNGDGYSDVIVGSPNYYMGQTNDGAAFVYHGSASGINTTAASRLESNQGGGTNFGSSVSGAGDVNGDGFSDVIVGANNYDNGQTNEGAAFVYYGSATGINFAVVSMVESNQASALMGWSVSGAGDVNGDGYSDVIVGAKGYDNGQTDEGAAFLYHGSSSGISTIAANRVESNFAAAQMGNSVSGAGDVNGDGFSDVIVGAEFYTNGNAASTLEGAFFVYHGSATGISTTAARMVESNIFNGSMGWSVAGAGDINGDGYSDVIVGVVGYENGQTSEGGAFIYHGSASGISTTAAAILESNQADSWMGVSVSGAGDVNGDGYSDVIVGAKFYNNGTYREGVAFVYHGSASGIRTTAAAMLESSQYGYEAQMGCSVSGAGDVNGDGYSDVIVGVFQYRNNYNRSVGAAFVYYGSASGISTTASATVESNQAGASMGWSVAGAGDVNGDGYSDVIVGAYQYDNGQADEGAAFIYHGSATGISTTAVTRIESDQAGAAMGYSVSGAGDVNGDGYSDVIVGAVVYDIGQTNEGAAFVYYGSASGISAIGATKLASFQASAYMGSSVSGAGDVNGDGYGDVIVGAVYYDNGQTDEGAAFIYHGSASGISTTAAAMVESNQSNAFMGQSVSGAGDVNGDGYSDVIVGAYGYDNGQTDEGAAFVYHGSVTGINTTAATMVESNQANALMGQSVSEAGDVNGDGYSDVIVGAKGYDNGQTDEGAAFVYHGSATGISTTAATGLESNQGNASLGYSVSGAGDVNGDGYSDVIVGSHLYTNVQSSEGAAFVYHGSATGISTTAAAMVEPNQADALFGWSVSGVGDVNGDGYSDVIVGARDYDNGLTNEGAAFLYLGNAGGSHAAANNIRAYNADASTRINQANASQTSFGAGLFAKSFQGRTNGKLVWEVVGNGSAFSGGSAIGNSVSSTSQQSSFTNLGLNGASLANSLSKTSSKANKVRVRVKYNLTTSLNGQVYGPWRNLYAANDLQEIVLKTITAGTASTNPTLCINTVLTPITLSTSGATGISNDNVAGANGLPEGVKANWASNLITISGTPTASGTFDYSIPLTGGFGYATGTITVTASPTTATAGVDQTGAATCGLTTVTLAGNTPTVGTGAWSIVSGTGGTITTASSPTSTFIGTAGSTYTLRWTISNSPCTASTDDVVITFNRNPTTANAGVDQTGAVTCGLSSVTLAGNTPTVGTGAWSIVSGTGGTITTTSSPTSTFTGTAGSTYTLRWTISNSPCTASTDDVVITFSPSPTTANAGVDQSGAATCGLTSVTLAGNTPTVGTGAWSIVSGTGGTITTASSPISTFSGTAGSTYTLRWTISNSPCTASTDDVVITFNRNPTTANAGVDQTGAATRGLTTVTLAGNSPTVGTGAWSIVSGTGGTITTASSPTSTFSGTAGSTYTLRWTIANSPCTASTDDVVITFNRNPPTIISFTPASGAPGTLVTITGTDLNGLSAFTIGGVATIAVSNTGATLVGMVMPGASTGTVGVTTPGGSATSSGTFTIQNTSYPIVQQGNKLTASNDLITPGKGWSVALSADGKTALVGGYYDNNGVGATWVYTRTGNTWAQQEKLIGTGAATNAWQGFSVALSADGNTAIVGGVIDNSAWVFTRSGTTWAQQGNKLVASDRVGNAWFGKSVSLSADGNTAILGGYWDNSNTGAAWVFTRSGNTWTQEGSKLVGTGAAGAAGQGHSVSLSADGNIAAIGGAYDDSQKGATWIFTRSGNTWVHQKIVVPGVGAAKQGQSVALSADATTLIIGGVNATSNVSNAWVFTRSGSTWTQQGTTFAGSDAVGTAANGTSVTLTADGNTAMMGSVSDNNNTGAAWVFTRSGSTWAQQGNKLLGTGATGTSLYEGRSVSLSADGSTALVGADGDNTNQGAVWAYSTGVLYNGNGNTGGSVPTSALATIGSSITLATNTGTLVKTGYTFAGWNTLANGTGTAYQSGASITLNSSLPLYARWTASDYTITFNANGGTGSMSNQTIAYLASANLTANTLTRTGYTFSGWATTSGGTIAYANSASYTMSTAANVTLYAKWCLNSASTTNVAVFSTSPTYLWNGIVRNAPGTYTYNTTNAIGCDSVATLHLTVVDPILPVTGINLSGTASDKQVKLSYKALNEREMANYAIERSAEGTNFTQIGMQQPINGTQASTSYGFIDNQPFVGINYYRIQGNSLNGQLQYSNVIALKVGNMMPTVTVAPNPILHQILNLKLNQLVKGNYKMIITDVIGRTVYGKQLPYDGVGTYIKTNLPVSIKPGMYYVRLSGEGNDFMDKFIIQ